MKITAKLAYNQIKINRRRTMWTWIAIALSTALTTAVCSFTASANDMLIRFLGEDYGQYGTAYVRMLFIPACILGILIITVSVTVISNVFRISAQERITQFGILKCTGATPKQIKETVLYEGLWMSLLGIPAGILLGLLLAFAGIQVAGYYIGILNDLVHLMIHEITIDLQFIVSPVALLVSSILALITVIYSAWRPARHAAQVSTICCIRGMDEIRIDEKVLHKNGLVHRIFGFEGLLANRNLKRSRKNFRATVTSLTIGMILFVSLGGVSAQLIGIQEFMDSYMCRSILSEYISDYENKVHEITRRDQRIYTNPIHGEMGNRIVEQLESYQHTDTLGLGLNNSSYFTKLSEEEIVPELHKAYRPDNPDNPEYEVEILVMDQENYKKLCEKANVPVGSNILINHYWYNDFGRKVEFAPLKMDTKKITLFDKSEHSQEIEIQGVLTQKDLPEEMNYPNMNPVRILMPDAEVNDFTWFSSPADEEGFMAYSNGVLQENFAVHDQDAYIKNGFSLRVYRSKEYIQVINVAISLASVIMYSFAALLMLIGCTNVISTLSTNVMMRAREFAVLKSIGMTSESMMQMLNYESILCSLKAMSIGIPIGILITIAVNIPIRSMLPIKYSLPWFQILLSACVVLFLTWLTTCVAVNRLKKQNIIEAIRSDL